MTANLGFFTGCMCGQPSQVEEYTDFLQYGQLYLAVKSLLPLASLLQVFRKH